MNEVDTTRARAPSESTGKGPATYVEAALTPPVDVVEDGTGITLYADLPGVSKDNLHLHVESDTLSIEAESSLSVPEGLQSSHTEGKRQFFPLLDSSSRVATMRAATLGGGCSCASRRASNSGSNIVRRTTQGR